MSGTETQWERLAEWIHCICIVDFDIGVGQVLEVVYPQHAVLTEQEKMNICYLAFPDSNSGCMGNTKFHICLRLSPDTTNTIDTLSTQHLKFNRDCMPVLKADSAHYWGFVYFRQVKDSTSKRGYFQKSFVILTRLPFINFFYELAALMAPIYFDNGLPCLEAACDNIGQWPRLAAGKPLTLQLLGNVYQICIPSNSNRSSSSISESSPSPPPTTSMKIKSSTSNDKRNNNSNSDTDDNSSNESDCHETPEPPEDERDEDNNHKIRSPSSAPTAVVVATTTPPAVTRTTTGYMNIIQQQRLHPNVLSSVHEIDIFNSLYSVMSHIHLLWELILTSEPIVVMAASPTDCSHMVQSLVSLISPLAYCGESRPYFTIHDSEFREFTQSTQVAPVSVILGVTNPYFAKTLQHWPHTIRLSEPLNITHNNDNNHTAMGSFQTKKLTKVKSISKLLGVTSGVLCTQYKPYLQKDKAIIKKIINGVKTKRPSVVQSAILKRYFLELTQSFMIPLERYMASLMPLQKDISPFRAPPQPHQFKQDVFLATLDCSGPQLTSTCRGDFEGLYKKFFRSSNFKGWYETRFLELQQTLQSLQLQVLAETDLNKWVQGKQEVEIVDMILRIKQKLHLPVTANSTMLHPPHDHASFFAQHQIKKEVREQLLRQLEDMKSSLPDDLKMILH